MSPEEMIKLLPKKLQPIFNKTHEEKLRNRMAAQLKSLPSQIAALKETLNYLDNEADDKDEEQILKVLMFFGPGPGRRGMDQHQKPDAEGLAERMIKNTRKEIEHLKKKIAEMR